jgi:hypothetical protein
MNPAPPVEGTRMRVWLAVAAATAGLIVRKPWSLTTPQLWAEDGSVHLVLVDRWGLQALLVPDRGYLNLIPRLIAWLAQVSMDVAHWPAIYNGGAMLVTIMLFARLGSARLQLPGKPWLVLAFVLVPCSGEVFLNIANVHWLTGFFFVLQMLITRPQTHTQRIGDITLLVLAGLTDPSSIIFLPLLAWRWWRENTRTIWLSFLAAARVPQSKPGFCGRPDRTSNRSPRRFISLNFCNAPAVA